MIDKYENPAAQAAVDEANATAASAQSEADAAASRLEAAQKDKENLEAQIEQTGKIMMTRMRPWHRWLAKICTVLMRPL